MPIPALSLTAHRRPPARGGAPRRLVMFLHGYGADGQDLLGLAPYWAQALPDCAFVSPDAPFPCEMGFGWQWFGFQGLEQAAIVAGARAAGGGWLNGNAALRSGALLAAAAPQETTAGANTTIAVIATDAPLDRSAAYRLAQNGHDAFARAIRPCHTPFDGDTIFALSTRPGTIEPFALATLAAAAEEVLERAILRAVRLATGAGGLPGLADRSCLSGQS